MNPEREPKLSKFSAILLGLLLVACAVSFKLAHAGGDAAVSWTFLGAAGVSVAAWVSMMYLWRDRWLNPNRRGSAEGAQAIVVGQTHALEPTGTSQSTAVSTGPLQFKLQSLLIAVTLTAIFLGLCRSAWPMAVFFLFAIVPFILARVGAKWGYRRVAFVIRSVAVAVLVFVATFAALFAVCVASGGGMTGPH